MVDSNDSFLREVKEELDRERLENLWKKYGALIVAVAAVVVVAVAGFQIWNSMAKRAAQQAGAQYQQALDYVLDNKLDEAASEFSELAKSGNGGYGALAQMQYAATLREQGKTEEAQKEFEALSKREGAEDLIRGFASLQAAALRLGTADFTEMKNRLNPLIKDGGPWRFNALELLGVAAMKADKAEEARTAFEKILAEANAPPAMRQRVSLRMAQLVAGDGADEKAEAAGTDKSGEVGQAGQGASGQGPSGTAN